MLKQWLSVIVCRIKYGSVHVRIDRKAFISSRSTFEGCNAVGSNTYFLGNIGYGSFIGDNCSITARIGRFCSIGSNVNVLSFTHPSHTFVSTHPAFYSTLGQAGVSFVDETCFDEVKKNSDGETLTIGNDVWICSNSTILPGIKIGDGAIVAAGAVVTKDVPPYAVVGGVPAKVLRYRFSEEDIARLTAFRWWDKDVKWLNDNCRSFRDIEMFRKLIDPKGTGDTNGIQE